VYDSAEYLLILSMDLVSCYPSVTYRIEVASGFSENVCSPELGHLLSWQIFGRYPQSIKAHISIVFQFHHSCFPSYPFPLRALKCVVPFSLWTLCTEQNSKRIISMTFLGTILGELKHCGPETRILVFGIFSLQL
jgi:hypothetical protein